MKNNFLKKSLIFLKNVFRKLGVLGILPFIVWPIFFLCVIFFIYRAEYNLSIENIEYEATLDAYEVADEFSDYLNIFAITVETEANSAEDMLSHGDSADEIQSFLTEETEKLDSVISGDTKGMYGYVLNEFVDGSGWVPDADFVPTERIWYKEAVKADGSMVIVEPYVDARTGQMVVTASKLLSDKKSVLAIDIWLSRMQQMTEELAGRDEDRYVIIIDRDGNIITHSKADEVGLNYRDSKDEIRRHIYDKWRDNEGKVFRVDIEDAEYLFYSKSISDSWTVITMNSAKPALMAIRRLTRNVIITAFLGLVIAYAVITAIAYQRVKIADYGENVQSISNIYSTMYRIDLETNIFETVACKDANVLQIAGVSGDHADKMIAEVLERLSDVSSRSDMLEFVDFSTLNERMANSDTISMEYLNHESKWYRARFIASERKEDGSLKSVIYAAEEIDKEKRSREKLHYMAETDALTKVSNRGSGENKIRQLLAEEESGMFLLFDVDRFKSINDEFGHGVGDRVLVAIGECMHKAFREKDIVLRLGGDEFAAFTPGVCNKDSGDPVVQRLMSCIDSIDLPELKGRKVEISVGVAFYLPDDSFSFDELYKRADHCTYISKKTEGSHVTYYGEEM